MKSAKMATVLTAILGLLLHNCTKRIKEEFLDTDSVRSIGNLRLLLTANLAKYWLLKTEKNLIYIYNVIDRFVAEDHGAPKSAGPLAIATFATTVNSALPEHKTKYLLTSQYSNH